MIVFDGEESARGYRKAFGDENLKLRQRRVVLGVLDGDARGGGEKGCSSERSSLRLGDLEVCDEAKSVSKKAERARPNLGDGENSRATQEV